MRNIQTTGNKSLLAGVSAKAGTSTLRYNPRRARVLAAGALLLALAAAPAFAHGEVAVDAGPNPLADSVRQANARFSDVAVALSEGYAPIPCVSGTDGGAMGIHYVNAKLIEDEAIDIAHPEAVMYEPGPDGKRTLIAVEYITTKGPAELDGHLFSFTNAPNRYGLPAFYELHVWAWRPNPTGTFSDMNPNASCDAVAAGTN
ncbi:hypothetical protein [Devosia sp.]|uniref:hypothetical protein n=1 Tax=Devosia sp. TaxID=1871048 RepID=UPI003F7040BA